MTVLAIDQGTTSSKAFLLHQDGRFEPVGTRTHEQFHPAEGLVEHDAEELATHVESLIDEALDRDRGIEALALTNQGETVVAWDRRTKKPLYRAIVWQDQRTQSMLDAWDEERREIVRRLSGLPLDAYFSASKLAWLWTNVPEVARAAREGRLGLGTSDAFFVDRLTGGAETDVTTASRTSLMNIKTLQWDPELCGLFGVPLEVLPRIEPTVHSFGETRRGRGTLPLVVSIVDQQAALFGHGCRKPGDMKITFGTGAFALALAGETPPAPRDGLVPTVAWKIGAAPALYALEGGDYTASAAVDWAIRVGIASSIADFELPDGPSALERGLAFVPSLAGLAAPHWDRNAAGLFLGLKQDTGSADLRRAVLEGVALRAAELIDVLAADVSATSIDGGLSKNAAFARFLADATGRPVLIREHADLTALGAAELGYHGIGKPPPAREAGSAARLDPGPRSARIRSLRTRFSRAIAIAREWG